MKQRGLWKRSIKSWVISSVFLFGSLPALSLAADFVKAESVSTPTPIVPFQARKDGVEGWVQLSFVITENGDVMDPIIHDSTGRKEFEEAALSAVKEWKYKPTLLDGKPTSQSLSKVQINFILETNDTYDEDRKRGEVDKRFHSRFTRALKYLQKGKLEKTKEKIEELEGRKRKSWVENSYLWVVQGYYHEKLGDPNTASKYFQRVVSNGSDVLPRPLYLEVLKKWFTASVQTNRLSEAAEAYEQFAKIDPEHKVLASIKPYYDQVKTFLSSNEPLEVLGVLPQNGNWHHKLERNSFQIVSAQKTLDQVEIRCDKHRLTEKSISQKAFKIPSDWGQCMVYVDGPVSAQFSLIEV